MRSVISVDMGHALTGFEADALARAALGMAPKGAAR